MRGNGYYWADYVLEDFEHAAFEPGDVVLDLGCGPGHQLDALIERGATAFGLDVLESDLAACRGRGLDVFRAVGEEVPLRTGSLDGIVCKVVVPLTDEAAVLSETARVLRAGGEACFTYHGAGYYLRYLLGRPPHAAFRFYGLRTLVNGWYYALFGRRLPGWLGDTIYQSRARLARHYERYGLELVRESPSPTFLGWPVFLYHHLRKTGRS
ncbi:MAG: methyltransferase domain-containing protein [Gemmatimonadota bacterium]|nr:methyltransferase domain-containing protein [Gemmatimonadota bacterium]